MAAAQTGPHVVFFVPGGNRGESDPVNDPQQIWTIGHSTLAAGEFIALLQAHDVRQLADVRRFASSRRHPQFNRESLTASLAAAGGVLIAMFTTFTATMGVVFTMKALIVVIMGGVGNMAGALLAGLMLGLAETAVARLVDPGLTIAVTYALFLAVLLWRPTGLFGRSAR